VLCLRFGHFLGCCRSYGNFGVHSRIVFRELFERNCFAISRSHNRSHFGSRRVFRLSFFDHQQTASTGRSSRLSHALILSLSHSLSHSLNISFTYSRTLTFSLILSISHSLNLALSLFHTLILSHLSHRQSHFLTVSISLSSTPYCFSALPSLSLSPSLCRSLSHSLSHTLTLSRSLSYSLIVSLSQSLILSLSHSLILALSHSLTVSFSHSRTLSFSHSLILSFSHSLILSLALSVSHSLILSFSHSLPHSLTHCLILSFSHSPTLSFSHSLTHSSILSFSHFRSLTLSFSLSRFLVLSLSLSLSLSHPLTRSLTLSFTHSLSHSLTLSFSLPRAYFFAMDCFRAPARALSQCRTNDTGLPDVATVDATPPKREFCHPHIPARKALPCFILRASIRSTANVRPRDHAVAPPASESRVRGIKQVSLFLNGGVHRDFFLTWLPSPSKRDIGSRHCRKVRIVD